jgi:hypothetical protein
MPDKEATLPNVLGLKKPLVLMVTMKKVVSCVPHPLRVWAMSKLTVCFVDNQTLLLVVCSTGKGEHFVR